MGLYNPRNRITDRRNTASWQPLKAGTCRNITIIMQGRFAPDWYIGNSLPIIFTRAVQQY